MKTIRYAFWGIVALCLIIVGLANRGMVTLHAMPTALAKLLKISPDVQVPLFVAIFLGVGAGMLIGFVWEWLRESRFRADRRVKTREVDRLKREMSRMRDADGDGKDDVLQLLEAPARR